MSWQNFVNGVQREKGDDATRTVTTYSAAGAVTGTRPYTTAENTAADAEAARLEQLANASTIKTDTTADLATLLADDTTVGSIRNLVGPSGAVAGTGNLRALAAQTNAAVVTAASVKALIRVNIDLAQLSINDVQATRHVARQVLRLAKDLVGDYASADVGNPSALAVK